MKRIELEIKESEIGTFWYRWGVYYTQFDEKITARGLVTHLVLMDLKKAYETFLQNKL